MIERVHVGKSCISPSVCDTARETVYYWACVYRGGAAAWSETCVFQTGRTAWRKACAKRRGV